MFAEHRKMIVWFLLCFGLVFYLKLSNNIPNIGGSNKSPGFTLALEKMHQINP